MTCPNIIFGLTEPTYLLVYILFYLLYYGNAYVGN